jgi:hypothetical protein
MTGFGDITRWERDLARKRRGITNETADVAEKHSDRILQDAQDNVRGSAFETGALFRALGRRVRKGLHEVEAEIGVIRSVSGGRDPRKYARHVHDGTATMAPRPFLDNANKKHTGEFETSLLDVAVEI